MLSFVMVHREGAGAAQNIWWLRLLKIRIQIFSKFVDYKSTLDQWLSRVESRSIFFSPKVGSESIFFHRLELDPYFFKGQIQIHCYLESRVKSYIYFFLNPDLDLYKSSTAGYGSILVEESDPDPFFFLLKVGSGSATLGFVLFICPLSMSNRLARE